MQLCSNMKLWLRGVHKLLAVHSQYLNTTSLGHMPAPYQCAHTQPQVRVRLMGKYVHLPCTFTYPILRNLILIKPMQLCSTQYLLNLFDP